MAKCEICDPFRKKCKKYRAASRVFFSLPAIWAEEVEKYENCWRCGAGVIQAKRTGFSDPVFNAVERISACGTGDKYDLLSVFERTLKKLGPSIRTAGRKWVIEGKMPPTIVREIIVTFYARELCARENHCRKLSAGTGTPSLPNT